MKNYGKDWENKVRETLSNCNGVLYKEDKWDKYDLQTIRVNPNTYPVDFERLYDTQYGKGINQTSDFYVYKYPNLIYLECKSCGDTMAYPQNYPQLSRILKRIKTSGVIGGFMLWFVKLKRVYWLDAEFVLAHLQSISLGGQKGVNPKYLDEKISKGVYGVFEIEQRTPRVFPEMDFTSWFDYIRSCYEKQNSVDRGVGSL